MILVPLFVFWAHYDPLYQGEGRLMAAIFNMGGAGVAH
jgi:hypothetical protein